MRNFLIITFILMNSLTNAQDVFQAELFSADMVLKYRNQIELSDQQLVTIRKVYNDNISYFNTLKWDLDAETVKLKSFLVKSRVDSAASMAQMNKILILETKLKQNRLSILLSIKNNLSEAQQIKLKELKIESNDTSLSLTTPINEDPRVVLKVAASESTEQPLYYIVDKKGKHKVESLSNIDPNNIASLEVIKGEKGIEEYGPEAKSGVILVKLKDNK